MMKKGISRALGLASALLIAALAVGLPGVTHAAPVVLSYNLDQTMYEYFPAAGTYWVGGSFGTDASSYLLDSVTLWMQMATSGIAQVDIYTHNPTPPPSDLYAFAGKPDVQIGTLTSPASYPTAGFGPATFTASGIALAPSSTYWVVLKALSGEFDWAYTVSLIGSGPGFQGTYGFTFDYGSGGIGLNGWASGAFVAMMMDVEATLVPAPATLLLFGSGLFGLAALGWRIRKG